MIRISRLLVCALIFTGLSAAFADLPMPQNPRWEPIVDEVYLQEVSSKIKTAEPLDNVAVLDGAVFVSESKGVHRVDNEKLVKVAGIDSKVSRR